MKYNKTLAKLQTAEKTCSNEVGLTPMRHMVDGLIVLSKVIIMKLENDETEYNELEYEELRAFRDEICEFTSDKLDRLRRLR